MKQVKKVRTAKHTLSLADICQTSNENSMQQAVQGKLPERNVKSQGVPVDRSITEKPNGRVTIKHADSKGYGSRQATSSQPVMETYKAEKHILDSKYHSQNSIEELPEQEDHKTDSNFQLASQISGYQAESIVLQNSVTDSQKDISLVEKSRNSQEDSRPGCLDPSNQSSDNATHIERSKTPEATPLKQSLVNKSTNYFTRQPSLSKSKKVAFSIPHIESGNQDREQHQEKTTTFFKAESKVEVKTEEICEKKSETKTVFPPISFQTGQDSTLKSEEGGKPKKLIPIMDNQMFIKSMEEDSSKPIIPKISPNKSKPSIFDIKSKDSVNTFFGSTLLPVGEAAVQKGVISQPTLTAPVKDIKVEAANIQAPSTFFSKPIIGPIAGESQKEDSKVNPFMQATGNQGMSSSSTFFKPASQLTSQQPANSSTSNPLFGQQTATEPNKGSSLFAGLREESNKPDDKPSSSFKFGDPVDSNRTGNSFFSSGREQSNPNSDANKFPVSAGSTGFFTRRNERVDQPLVSSIFRDTDNHGHNDQNRGNSFFGQSRHSGEDFGGRNRIEEERNDRGGGGAGFFSRDERRNDNYREENRGGYRQEENRGNFRQEESTFGRGGGGGGGFFNDRGPSNQNANNDRLHTNPFLVTKPQTSIFGGSSTSTAGNRRTNNSVLNKSIYE